MNHLCIGTVACDQDIFKPQDLLPLLGRSTRGSNRLLPKATGRRAKINRRDELDVTLTWFVNGRKNPGGTITAAGTGLLDNLAYYKAAFFNQADASTGLTAGTLILENGTLQADLQVRDWSAYWTGPLSATVATRIVVPSGEWT